LLIREVERPHEIPRFAKGNYFNMDQKTACHQEAVMAESPAPSNQPISFSPEAYSWFVDFQDAVLASAEDIDPSKLQEKVMRVEGEIFDRLQSLTYEPDHMERHAIRIAESRLLRIKNEQLGYPRW
jgi:hypothetical protein